MKQLVLLGISTMLCFPIFSQEEKVVEQVTNENTKQPTTSAGSNQTVNEDEEEYATIFVKVEKKAEFPGGTAELISFLKTNLQYPPEAIKEKIQGKVFLEFVIQKNGEVTDISVIRAVHPLLDAEAVRVVKLMPKWKPAEVNGKAVSSRFRLPISFGF